jgi:serine/threonine protein kinase
MNDKTKLCVKFTQKYSKDAHQYCAEKGVAPKLFAVEDLSGGWLMVVMEYLERDSYMVLVGLSKDARSSFAAGVTEAVEILHQGGFMHGDIRDANTMVARDWDQEKGVQNVKLVDFDWAGREGETKYPPNVNYWAIARPMGAKDGLPVERDHDLEMIKFIFAVRLPIYIPDLRTD